MKVTQIETSSLFVTNLRIQPKYKKKANWLRYYYGVWKCMYHFQKKIYEVKPKFLFVGTSF
jgi:hypothetical protein